MQTAMLVVVSFLSISKSPWKSGQSHWTDRWKASETVYNEAGLQGVRENFKIQADGADHGSTKTVCFCLQEKAEEVAVHQNDPSRGKPRNNHGCHYHHRKTIWADEASVSVRV